MKKQFQCAMVIVALSVLFGSGSALAEDTHVHPVCGATCGCLGETHEDITWTAWESDDNIPQTAGNYYLTKDITLSYGTQIQDDVKICLNGYTISQESTSKVAAITVTATGSLDLTDCQGGGTIRNEQATNIRNAGTFRMYEGIITGCASTDTGGGGVYNTGIFHMYDGKITDNHTAEQSAGGGVEAFDGEFYMHGGEISNNTAGNGGGVHVFKGTFHMLGGKITGNEATRNIGGGVHIADSATEVVIKGEIANNSAELYGGGICCDSDITIIDAKITGNDAPVGGGVCEYFSHYPVVTLGGSTVIDQNTVTGEDTPSNLTVFRKEKLAIDEATPLSGRAKIGVNYYYQTTITEEKPLSLTSINDSDYSEYFSSDNEAFVIQNIDNGLWLAVEEGSAPITSIGGGSTNKNKDKDADADKNTADDKDKDQDSDKEDKNEEQKDDADKDSRHNFVDVATDAWYAGYVDTIAEKGLMNGTSDTIFSPDVNTSRGMIAAILWRLSEKPGAKGEAIFADVKAGVYYAEAIAWANENGVVKGYSDEIFAPGDAITREQMAAMLYRYAQSPATTGTLDGFVDKDQVSDYAKDALAWAVEQGIINGRDGNVLVPKDQATRAEVAAIISRYLDKLH